VVVIVIFPPAAIGLLVVGSVSVVSAAVVAFQVAIAAMVAVRLMQIVGDAIAQYFTEHGRDMVAACIDAALDREQKCLDSAAKLPSGERQSQSYVCNYTSLGEQAACALAAGQ
jgi:hypothetical protein